eukprot:7819660-Ditylum_brightwellii.AAC.1
MSASVSVVMQKKAVESMYPIGKERWKPMRGGLPGRLGTTNAREGTSLIQSQTRMYALLRSTFCSWMGLSVGSA